MFWVFAVALRWTLISNPKIVQGTEYHAFTLPSSYSQTYRLVAIGIFNSADKPELESKSTRKLRRRRYRECLYKKQHEKKMIRNYVQFF